MHSSQNNACLAFVHHLSSWFGELERNCPTIDVPDFILHAGSMSNEQLPTTPLGSSIRVVSNRTGIAAETLRVWERRYGFPNPKRRDGGSRVYTELEITKLKLIANALEAGFRAGEVVPLSEADITRLLSATTADLLENHSVERGAQNVVPEADKSLDQDQDNESAALWTTPERGLDALFPALERNDLATFRSLLRSAARHLSPQCFVMDLAQPLAKRVGEQWALGKLTVRQEHLVTASLTSMLHVLFEKELQRTGEANRGPLVVLATLTGEAHIQPLDMVALYLAAEQALPRMVGADTPPSELAEAARTMRADAVGISISPAAKRDVVELQIRELLDELPRRTELWIGGTGAQGLITDVQGVFSITDWSALDARLSNLRADGVG
jgi:MerR family transcriptional regulator, light-induced transcriptional regulator